jgi:hypothetical protein
LSHLWIVDSWDTDDLELFDLVEEVNQNFYEVIGVEQVNNDGNNCDHHILHVLLGSLSHSLEV